MIKQTKISILSFVVLLSSVLGSCKESRIPDNDMVKILVDVFITDALISSSKLSIEFSKRDSIEYYQPIYSSMGYSETQFINTIDYYLDNHDVLDKVLDKVVNELSRLETERIAREKQLQEEKKEEDKNNLWKRKQNWILPKDGKKETLAFKIPINGVGVYTISADVRVMPTDESINPEMIVWFYSDDDSEEGFRLDVKSEQYIKDSISRTVTITNILNDSTVTHIMGFIMNHQPKLGDWQKNADISNISIRFSVLPSKRDRDKGFMKVENKDKEIPTKMKELVPR